MSRKRKLVFEDDFPQLDYFMNEDLCDVVFIIDGQRVPALKSTLITNNKVFRAMFSDNFKESKDKEVVIKDTTFEAFKTLIEFIYTDQLVLKDGTDQQLIEEVLRISDRYEAFRIVDKMAKHLKTIPFTLENIELISRIADKSENKGLIEKVMEFIGENQKEFNNKNTDYLISLNDSTHNYLLIWLEKNHRKLKQELANNSFKLSRFQVFRCNVCYKKVIHHNAICPDQMVNQSKDCNHFWVHIKDFN